MNLLLIQIVIVLIAAVVVAGAIRRFRKREMSARWFALWVALWVGASIVVLIPKTSERIAAILGVGRGVDVVMYLSIAALFYFMFRIMTRIDRMERDITKIVREVALKKDEKRISESDRIS